MKLRVTHVHLGGTGKMVPSLASDDWMDVDKEFAALYRVLGPCCLEDAPNVADMVYVAYYDGDIAFVRVEEVP